MSSLRLSPAAWTIVVCGSVLLLLAFGFRASFGLFVQPMSAANDWGRDLIGMALAIQNLTWGVLAVLAGGLADRFGKIKVMVVGAICYAVGLWLVAGVDDALTLQFGAGLLVGAGLAGTGFGIVLPMMANAVAPEDRQWVLGVGTAAGSMGQFLIVPLAQLFIDQFGWSQALVIMSFMAAAMVLLLLPIAALAKPAQDPGQVKAPEVDFGKIIKAARGHGSYWLLTLGFFVCGFHLAFITVHFPGYLTDNGFEPKVAAWSIALIGLCNVFGALLSGYISGRLSMKKVLMFIYISRGVVTVALLLLPLSLLTVLTFSCVTGFLWLATVPPTSGLVATMFGTRYMATLYGVVFLGHQLGSFTGVWLGGYVFEHTGNYDAVWWLGVALSLVAVVLHWPIIERRARDFEPAAT